MSVIYKKGSPGRLNIAQRELLTKVNGYVRGLPPAQRKKFQNLVVNNDKDLQELYASLSKGESATFEFKGKNKGSLKPIEEITKEPIVPTEEPIINEEPIKSTIMADKTAPATDVPEFFNPLYVKPKERSYNTTHSSGDTSEIPEPDFGEALTGNGSNDSTIHNVSGDNSPTPSPSNSNPQPSASAPEPTMVNPELNELDAKEKRIACAQAVDTALDAYAALHTIATNFVTVDEAKIQEKIIKGELDPSITFPIDEQGNESNAVHFFQEMNKQTEEALSYDPAFGEKVRPAMMRVFEKKGIGFKDEHYLMYMFGKDIAMKASIVIGLKKQTNLMMTMFAQMKQDQMANQIIAEAEMTSVKPDKIHHPQKPQEEEPELQPQSPEDIEDSFVNAEVVEEN